MKQPPREILSPAHLVHYALYDYIGKRAAEHFIAVFLNVRNIMVGFTEYTSGSSTDVAINPSGIFRDALLANAAAIITVHQHPTGKARPSDADEILWGRLTAIGELMGIPVVDNLVLGEDEFYSEAENTMTSYTKLRIMLP
jgi:DNA repair protein RadC